METKRILLSEKELPEFYYNIQADLPKPLPPVIHPGTGNPIGPEDLAPLFPTELIKQEVSLEKEIPIPEEVRDIYSMWRPTPLVRATRLEKALATPAKIYYKNESVSPAGSHKPNTAIAQAYYNKLEGTKRLTTETGAGQWGSALSFACSLFDMECEIYMVKASYHHKPYRKSMIQTWGADVYPSPSERTNAGRNVLKDDPDCPGSLGIAISEAVELAAQRSDTKYALGSVLNHVMLHQSIIGIETKKAFEKIGEYPDVMIGCVGGGSNFAGLTFPFIKDKIDGKRNTKFIAVEPAAAPSMTKGQYVYDFGDTAQTTPLMKMYTLGHSFVPAPIHAGGLRYHGMAPLVCHLYDMGIIDAIAVKQTPVFEAAIMFARTEGIIPAPESSHAIKAAIDEALKCRESGEAKTIVFELSGHGHFDMGSYDAFLAGEIKNISFEEEKVQKALSLVPTFA
jgi:tryptophan synthase beta chain